MQSNFGRTLQCILFGFIALVVTSMSLDAFSKPPAVQTPVFKDYFESIEPGQEFKIKIPPKWIAEVGTQRFAVTLKPSSKAERIKLPGGVIADPNITVAVVKKPVSFSQDSLEAVAKEIEESFIRFNGAGTGFQIFQKNLLTDLPGGQSGLLYYVSFKSDGTEAGQAILVMGNEKIRYRVTLSDHRLNFDRNLELYYPYMTSLEFNSNSVAQSAVLGIGSAQAYLPWLIAAIAVLVCIVLISRLRRSAVGAPSGMGDYPASGVSQAPGSMNSAPMRTAPTSLGSTLSSEPSNLIQSNQTKSVGTPEYSMIPQSMIGVSGQGAGLEPSSEPIDPAFSDKDLSSPPQSVPLSQVVDESSAPPDLKKRWQIFTKNRS